VLKTLRIRNLATIEDLRVEFSPGLNVITGETGAGKSIVVEALGLVCGDRADSALLRAGTDRAVIEAAFSCHASTALAERVEACGLDAEGDELVIRREIAGSGGGRVVVNGSPSSVSVLRELGDAVVDLHGQHEQRGLLAPERHLALLDAFGAHDPALASVAAAHAAVVAAAGALAGWTERASAARFRQESLEETIRAIREIAPRPGEQDALRTERSVLQNGARVSALIDEAIARLDEGDDHAIAKVHAAERRVQELSSIDPALAELSSRLAAARVELEDARDTLAGYRDRQDFEPGRLDAIETRRAALDRLLLRWGPTEDDALRQAAEAEAELAALDTIDVELAAAAAESTAAETAYRAAAGALTQARQAAAAKLGPAVERELAPLALAKARFSVVLVPRPAPVPHPQGAERAEFHLAANPGEPARPLARAASGGELSRVMLALHVVSDASADPRVLVFDEVDAGVSGAVALAVGARLARLGLRHQVLCVTHLPQVAAHATGHYHVSKRVSGGRTHTGIAALDGQARVDELARMLGGRQATGASRENAVELLAEAERTMRVRGRR
jgi:DNA repair protein RecN (Recombination protein N)